MQYPYYKAVIEKKPKYIVLWQNIVIHNDACWLERYIDKFFLYFGGFKKTIKIILIKN
jgi:hypothetical protein